MKLEELVKKPFSQFISRKVIWLISGIIISIFSLVVYLVGFKYAYPQPNNEIIKIETEQKLINDKIKKIQSGTKILLYSNFMVIAGKSYQIEYRNGQLMIKKNGQWVPIETATSLKNHTAFFKMDGKSYQYKNGRNVPLHSGDIIFQDGKPYMIDKNGDLIEVETDGILWEDGVPYVIDEFGNKVLVKDGETLTINGKTMLYKDGKFIPFADSENNEKIIVKNGKHYRVLADGTLEEILAGEVFYKNGKAYTVDKNGKAVLYVGDLEVGVIFDENGKKYTIDSDGNKIEILDGDNFLYRGRNGIPLYFKMKNQILKPIEFKKILDGEIINYNGKYYRKGADNKLHSIKTGDVIYKNDKAYVMDANGDLIELIDGDSVLVDGNPMTFLNGNLIAMNQEDMVNAVKNKSLFFEKGKAFRLDANGNQIAIVDGEIIFRNGKPYRYKNGKFTLLKKDPNEKITPKKKNVKKKPTVTENEEPTTNFFGGSDEELQAALNSSLSIDITTNTDSPSDNSSNPNDAVQKYLDSQNNGLDISNALDGIGNQDNSYDSQNNQSGKTDFLNNSKESAIPSSETDIIKATSPYTLEMGSLVPAILLTGINSDMPGSIIAQVSRNIFDTRTGNYLLIPQGAKLIGSYDSSITFGQSRVLMVWTTLVMPNGDKINLQAQQGVNLSGQAGIGGSVDNHWGGLVKNILFMSLFGGAVQYATGGADTGGDNLSSMQLIAASLGQQIGEAGVKVIEKNMDIQPTIEIDSGQNFNILLARPFIFNGPYHEYNESPIEFF